jgi:hypothetical protein
MDRKTRYDFAKPQHPYGAVETALAEVFDVKRAAGKAKVRAHVKHLQRLGLGGGAGKGARVRYTLAQASQWLLAMLMNEVDVDPVISVQTIQKAWPQLERWFERALDNESRAGDPVWLILRPEPMTGWANQGSVEWIGAFRWKNPRSKELPYTLLTQANDEEWLCTRNLSVVMLKFVRALGLEPKPGEK